MNLARLTTAAFGLTAAALFGMAGAGVYAFQGRADDPKPAPAAPEPAPESSGQPTLAPRRPPAPITDRPSAPMAPTAEPIATTELAAQLEYARKKFARVKQLRDRGAVTQTVADEEEAQVRIVEGRAAGQAEQLEEELELLKIRLDARRAQLDGAMAQVGIARADLERLRQQHKKGSLIPEDITEAEAVVKREDATRAVRVSELRESEARIRQIERRLQILAPLLKAANPAPKPGTAPESERKPVPTP